MTSEEATKRRAALLSVLREDGVPPSREVLREWVRQQAPEWRAEYKDWLVEQLARRDDDGGVSPTYEDFLLGELAFVEGIAREGRS